MINLEEKLQPKKTILRLIEIYKNMPGDKKIGLSCELYDLSREIVTSSILSQYPDITNRELHKKTLERFLDKKLIEKLENKK